MLYSRTVSCIPNEMRKTSIETFWTPAGMYDRNGDYGVDRSTRVGVSGM
jgi:hypothetical protein